MMGEQLDMFEARQEPLPLSTQTLTETLAALGYTHRTPRSPAPVYAREVVDAAGRVVFTGRADAVWKWLADGRPER